MTWKKHGRVFGPESVEWAASHAQLPTARQLDESVYRVYFAARNEQNMSRIGYVDIDVEDPHDPVDVASRPVLELGPIGAFDDSGVFPHWIVERGDEVLLYYTGWMRGDRVPYYAAIGLAREEGTRFERLSRAPILPRSDVDPYLMHSPCVLVEDGTWRLWYASATEWDTSGEAPKPHYHVRYAESPDGRRWDANGTVCIDYEHEDEWAIARPCVRRTDDGYRMWYCYSRDDRGYRIGCAESDDGVSWTRRDGQVGIEPSADGWDSNALCYPYVFEHDRRTYMLYNGSDFGERGFGLAERTQ